MRSQRAAKLAGATCLALASTFLSNDARQNTVRKFALFASATEDIRMLSQSMSSVSSSCISSKLFEDLCYYSMTSRAIESQKEFISTEEYVTFLHQSVAITSIHGQIASKRGNERSNHSDDHDKQQLEELTFGQKDYPPPSDRFDKLEIDLQLPFVKYFCDFLEALNSEDDGAERRSINHIITGECYADMRSAGQTDKNFGFPVTGERVIVAEPFLRSTCREIYERTGKRGWVIPCKEKKNQDNLTSVDMPSNGEKSSSTGSGMKTAHIVGVGAVVGLLLAVMSVLGWVVIKRRKLQRRDEEIFVSSENNMQDRSSERDMQEEIGTRQSEAGHSVGGTMYF